MSTFSEARPGSSIDVPDKFADDDQSYEEPQEHNFRYWVVRGIAKSFLWYDEARGCLSRSSQQEIDLTLLKQAEEYGPRTQGKAPAEMQRFRQVMEHFLSGRKSTLYFKMAELLRSCEGARDRVKEAIAFRLARNGELIFGSPSCDLPTHEYLSNGKPGKYSIYQFPIRQGEYHDTDWQFALGTFTCLWEPLWPATAPAKLGPLCTTRRGRDWVDEGTTALTCNSPPGPKDACSSPPRPTRAKVWGTKVWRWHSSTERSSEGAHQAAYRLVQSGKLHNFWVIAEPCIIDIGSGRPI